LKECPLAKKSASSTGHPSTQKIKIPTAGSHDRHRSDNVAHAAQGMFLLSVPLNVFDICFTGEAQREAASSRDRRPSDKVAAQCMFFFLNALL
jgi:hypothetical protein